MLLTTYIFPSDLIAGVFSKYIIHLTILFLHTQYIVIVYEIENSIYF